MASIRKAKKMGTYVPIKVDKELRALINETNRRLRNLEKQNINKSYAEDVLRTKLSVQNLSSKILDKQGKIKISKNLTSSELVQLNKAIQNFISSKTSTAKGIRITETKNIKGIQRLISDPEQKKKVNIDDAKLYYDMFQSNDIDYFTSKIRGSDLINFIEEAKEKNMSETDWIELLNTTQQFSNDEEFKRRATNLYNKYVLL